MSQTGHTKMTLNNPAPLPAGEPRSLSFIITTEGYKLLYIVVPVGSGAADLMDVAAFKNMRKPSIQGGDANMSVDKQENIGGGEATLVIDSIPTGAPQTFTVVMGDFTVNSAVTAEKVRIRLEDENSESLDAVDIVKTFPRPGIKAFVASRYNVIRHGEVTFSWVIENGGKYRLSKGESVLGEGDAQGGERSLKGEAKGERNVFRLEALTATGEITDTRLLAIHTYDQTAVKSYPGPGEGILGLYGYSGRLYGIVKGGGDPEWASLWSTGNGFAPEAWQLVKDGLGRPTGIPMAFAGSPGVVFQKKLWLMGGSSYDPNHISDQAGYYGFELNTWIEDAGTTFGKDARWPKDMGERMGHAMVVSPDGKQVWVMGGYDQSGGAKNDIWAFDGIKWQRLPDPPWEPRCMAGATTATDSVWIGGGFVTPGGESFDDIWRWDHKTGWKEIDLSLIMASDTGDDGKKQYCACTFAFLNAPYFFATYYDPKQDAYESTIVSLTYGNNQWSKHEIKGVTPDWAMVRDYYSLSSVVHNGSIFTRRLARHETDENIHYFVQV